MERDNRQAALSELIAIADSKGYLLFDDVMTTADSFSLPLPDFDWLTESITTRGILIYDEEPHSTDQIADEDEIDDYAQVDYDAIYSKAIEMDSSLSFLIESIKKIKPPQFREVSQLKHLVREGNRHARDRMIEMHMRNAVRLAVQRAETYDCPIDETLQYALIGLISAVDKYDPNVNGAFASYANLYMVQSVSRDQSTQNTCLYYPVHRKEAYFAVYSDLKKAGLLEYDFYEDHISAIEIIMDKLACDQEKAVSILYSAFPALSLEAINEEFFKNIFVFEKHGIDISKLPRYTSLTYTVTDELDEELDRQSKSTRIRDMLDTLSEREKTVLSHRYGLIDGMEQTLAEVGDILHITRERVRQIETKAITKLQHHSRFKVTVKKS